MKLQIYPWSLKNHKIATGLKICLTNVNITLILNVFIATIYILNFQTRYCMMYEFKHGTISLKTFFGFKQAVSCNRLTMANESDYESDPVRKIFDLNRCIFFKKKSRKNWATRPLFSRTKLGNWTMVQLHVLFD